MLPGKHLLQFQLKKKRFSGRGLPFPFRCCGLIVTKNSTYTLEA